MECYLAVRGIKTLGLRMKAAQESSLKLAEFLSAHPKVSDVFYPGLKTHQNYELHKSQARGPGAMLSFNLKGGAKAALDFVKGLKIVVYAVSLGAVETLVTIPAKTTHACVDEATRKEVGVTEGLIRISVGVEDYDDLLDDIKHGLDAVSN